MLFLIDALNDSYLPQIPVRSTATGILQETWLPGTSIGYHIVPERSSWKEVMDEEWDRVIPVWNIFIRLGIFGPNIVPRQNLDPYVTSTLAY